MNILVLNGSPRPNGNTAAMVSAFTAGAMAVGHQVDVVNVCRKNIHGCLGCEYCHTKGSGKCIQDDDMQEVYPLLERAEMIVLASPIYYHGFSGQLQCALNRIYALDKPKNLKRAALFLSSGDRDVYDGAVYAYRNSFLGYLKLEDMGIYTAFGEQNKSEELLNRLNAFGWSLMDIHEGGYSMSGHIAALSDSVTRKKVVYKNRYGMGITGELYHSKALDLTQRHPAIIVGAPYGGVKEQGPCVYGNELAQRGFVVLTFDQSFMGESGGFPWNVSSPDIFTENFSAAVDFLGLQSFVDWEKIGAIGIYGSGGFALSAAQMDTRIKAVATASMYDMSVAVRGGQDRVALQAAKEQLAAQRWKDAENGYPEYLPGFPEQPIEEVPANIPEPDAEWMRFYAVKRGHHPNARGGFTTTSALTMMNFPLLAHIDEISPRPILFVVGDRAHSKFFSENAYAAALEPKELYEVADAEHIDLYDRTDRIPFDKLAEFFCSNLK